MSSTSTLRIFGARAKGLCSLALVVVFLTSCATQGDTARAEGTAAGAVIGGAVGAGLGLAGAALITRFARKLSATIPTASGQRFQSVGPGGSQGSSPTDYHTLLVPMHASVTSGVIVLAVLLAVAGGVLAGTFGSWRIGRLRPADALRRVE